MTDVTDFEPSAASGRDPETGRFLPCNLAAVQHALRTDRLPAEFAHLAEEVAEFVSASIADDGGIENVPHRRQSLHNYRVRVHRRGDRALCVAWWELDCPEP